MSMNYNQQYAANLKWPHPVTTDVTTGHLRTKVLPSIAIVYWLHVQALNTGNRVYVHGDAIANYRTVIAN